MRSASGTQYFPKDGPNSFFNPQYSSLYAWRSASNGNYHAMQVNLRHRMEHGVQFDFNYTFSKSIEDRKSTRLNSSHGYISYAVFCLKKKKTWMSWLSVTRNGMLLHVA